MESGYTTLVDQLQHFTIRFLIPDWLKFVYFMLDGVRLQNRFAEYRHQIRIGGGVVYCHILTDIFIY